MVDVSSEINTVYFVTYTLLKVCDECGVFQRRGYEFVVIRCVCGCGEFVRICMLCTPDSTPTCAAKKIRVKMIICKTFFLSIKD